MQLERTRTGWLGTRARFLVIAVIVLAVAGITIPLMAKSGTTAQPAQPASGVKTSPPALAMMSFAGYAGRPALPGAPKLAVKAIALSGRRAPRGRQRRRLSSDMGPWDYAAGN